MQTRVFLFIIKNLCPIAVVGGLTSKKTPSDLAARAEYQAWYAELG